MSSFNNILKFGNNSFESISSLKNISNTDIFYNYNLNKRINIKNIPKEMNSKYENKTEVFAAFFQWDGKEKNVYITGSFCNWNQFFEMRKIDDPNNKSNEKNDKLCLVLFLPKGTYQYKFKINSIWKCNTNFPTCSDKDGNINNVITIPSNKIEEGITDLSTSHMTLQKFEEVNNFNNFISQKDDLNSFDEFSYKYYYNFDLLSNQNKLVTNLSLESKEKDILNGNYSYKTIYPIPHELINHFNINQSTIKKYNDIDNMQTLKFACTTKYNKKMTTFVYYKPK